MERCMSRKQLGGDAVDIRKRRRVPSRSLAPGTDEACRPRYEPWRGPGRSRPSRSNTKGREPGADGWDASRMVWLQEKRAPWAVAWIASSSSSAAARRDPGSPAQPQTGVDGDCRRRVVVDGGGEDGCRAEGESSRRVNLPRRAHSPTPSDGRAPANHALRVVPPSRLVS